MKGYFKSILVLILLLTACSSKEEKNLIVDEYEKTSDWMNFDSQLSDDGIYLRKVQDKNYIVLYGKETKYTNLFMEYEDDKLIIRFDSVSSTGGCYKIYEIETNGTFEHVEIYENGEKSKFVSVVVN